MGELDKPIASVYVAMRSYDEGGALPNLRSSSWSNRAESSKMAVGVPGAQQIYIVQSPIWENQHIPLVWDTWGDFASLSELPACSKPISRERKTMSLTSSGGGLRPERGLRGGNRLFLLAKPVLRRCQMPVRAGLGVQTEKKEVLVLFFVCSGCGFEKTVSAKTMREAYRALHDSKTHYVRASFSKRPMRKGSLYGKRLCGLFRFDSATVQFE